MLNDIGVVITGSFDDDYKQDTCDQTADYCDSYDQCKVSSLAQEAKKFSLIFFLLLNHVEGYLLNQPFCIEGQYSALQWGIQRLHNSDKMQIHCRKEFYCA